MDANMTINIHGTRGSVPVNGSDFVLYGGATSCVSVSCGDTLLFLDAGSGIVGAALPDNRKISILLSHLHLDHLIGLPLFKALFQPNLSIDIYGRRRNGVSLEDALHALFHPPYWPVGLKDFPANVTMNDIDEHFTIGSLQIDTMEGSHPGGSTVYRISHEGKSFVYATDFEHNKTAARNLTQFCKDADLLLYDAQYTDEEYPGHSGYGHSTPSAGIRIAEEANVSQLLFSHHAPEHTDRQLSALENRISAEYPFASFAKAGMQIEL